MPSDRGTVARTVTDDGATIAVESRGDIEDRDRPLAVLQHGFPDTPATWRHIAPALVEDGYRVVMPWLRGYPPSVGGRARVTIDRLAEDLLAVHDAFGGDDRAVLVGHDWGAAASWAAAAAGGRATWSGVVAMAVPPEPAMHGFLRAPRQLWRSRYMIAVQLPWAEQLSVATDLAGIERLWARWSPGYSATAEDLEPLRASIGSVAGARGAFAPYRAQLVSGLLGRAPRAHGPVPPQVSLYLHGADDGCIGVELAARARPVLRRAHPRSEVHVLAGAGHFLHLERPAAVTGLIRRYLADIRAEA